MDKSLKFDYRMWIFWGGNEIGRSYPAQAGSSSKTGISGKSLNLFNRAASESFLVVGNKSVHFSFQETPHWVRCKSDKIHILPYQLPTQVGWSSRLRRSGERCSRNSAINLGVTFGRCLAACKNAATTKDYLATVYLKHRSLQSRKATYRGWHLPSAGKSNIVNEVSQGISLWYKLQ